MYYTERKPKNKNGGRPGTEATDNRHMQDEGGDREVLNGALFPVNSAKNTAQFHFILCQNSPYLA